MIRLLNAYIPKRTLQLVVSEGLLIFLALGALLFLFRGEDAELYMFYEQDLLRIGIVSGVFLLSMYYYDLYGSFVVSSTREVITRLVQAFGASFVALALVYYVRPEMQVHFGVFVAGTVLVGTSLLAWRKLFFAVNQSPRFADRVVLLGEGTLTASLATEIEKRPELGVHLLGYVDSGYSPAASLNGCRHLGNLEDLPALVEREAIDRVIVTMGDRRGRLPVETLLRLKTRGVLVQDGADFHERMTGKLSLDFLRLSWLLFSPGFGVSRVTQLYKRTASVLFSLFGVIVGLPVMALIAVAIRLDSPGPVIFHQQRVGRGGKLFTLFKFRSMRAGADPEGKSRPAREGDERFTRLGRWLRRTRLDELPQLYNILRGEMSFVGPRPFARDEEEEFAREIPYYPLRWTVKPGATGWAQIHRGYCASLEDNIEKLSYDLFYVKNMSLGLDLLIVLQTIKILLLGRGSR